MTERRVFSQPSQASLRMQRSWSSSSSVTSSPNGTPFSSPVKAPMSTKSSTASFALSSSLKEQEEADDIIMFSGPDIRLMQFATFRKHSDYDSPPDRHNCWKESTVAKGEFEVYKMLGKKAAYMRCQGFVHPILPKLRMWRTEWNEFVLPQPIPEKYWRIILPTGDGYDEFMGPNLEQVFQGTCSYKCVMPPPQPPSPPPEIEELDESEESSMVETVRDIKQGTADSSFGEQEELPTLSGIVTPEYRPLGEQSPLIFEDELRSKFLDMRERTPPDITFDVSSDEQDVSFEEQQEFNTGETATQEVPQSNVFDLTDEDPYSSSSSTLDRVLDSFESSSEDNDTLTIAPPPVSLSTAETSPSTASLESTDTNTTINTHQEENVASSPALSSVSTAVFQAPDLSDQEPALTLSPPSTARKSYMNHPLVPLATRNNILSSTYPIRFKPMEDDWLEVSGGTIPAYQFMAPNGKPGYMSWASQVTNDLVSSSSNYLSDKMEKMTLASAAYVPKLGASHPQSYWHKDYAVPSPTSDTLSMSSSRIRDGSPVSHLRQRSLSTSSIQSMIGSRRQQEFPEVPDFYHQAATVSGYVGWRLWNKVSPWAKRT